MSMTFATNVVVDDSHNLSLQGLPIYYGTCTTAAGTAVKAVTCANFTLATGAMVYVKFTNTNSYKTLGSIKMNVNSTGDKVVKKIINGAIGNLKHKNELQAGLPLLFGYNGTYWVLLSGADYDTTGTAPTAMTTAQAQAGTDTTAYTVSPSNMAAGIKRYACFKAVLNNIASLPKTFTVTGVTANHEVIESYLSNGFAQPEDWTVTTAANSITISGDFEGSTATNLILYLGIPESVTGTSS